jgi:hypothetical protein
MAEITRELSQEYWRPAPPAGSQFQTHGFQAQAKEAFCASCGTPYAAGARFCHLCGRGREDDLHAARSPVMDWFDLDVIRTQSGLSTVSLIFVLAATIFLLATVMTGLIYNTSTLAEWQAVQTWRVEWLLATVVALLAAILFKSK